MTTLEAIMQDLQQVSPPHLEEVRALVRTLRAKEEANQQLAAQLHEVFSEPDDLSAEAWADIDAHMRQVRTELFTRPNPFEGADAA